MADKYEAWKVKHTAYQLKSREKARQKYRCDKCNKGYDCNAYLNKHLIKCNEKNVEQPNEQAVEEVKAE
jgi:hypothetical protein